MNAAILLSFGSAIVSLAAVGATFYGIRYTNRINMQLQKDRLRSDQRHQNQEMLRLKGEEAFELIGVFQTSFRQNISDLASHLIEHGRYSRDSSFDLTESVTARGRVELLVKTYFPSAIPQLLDLMVYEGRLSLCAKDLAGAMGDLAQKTAAELVSISFYVDEHSQKLQQVIVMVLQELHEDVNELFP